MKSSDKRRDSAPVKKPFVNPYLFFGSIGAGVSGLMFWLMWTNFPISPIVAYFIAINMAAVFLMGIDKSQARGGSLRSPETILYTLGLLGGSPGLLLGVHVFRHKTRDAGFQLVLMLIFAAQLFLLKYLGIRFAPGAR